MTSFQNTATPASQVVVPNQRLDQVLRRAAAETGVSFEYLVETAKRESSFNPELKASTSSATGLFQFIEQTWLATVKKDGARFGLTEQASKIEQRSDGRYFVSDAKLRADILDLRKEPDISSKLAGALTQRNAETVSRGIGREPTAGELYIAHFLGAKGAVDLVKAAERQPGRSAVDLFPAAANANKSLFFAKDGSENSASKLYAELVSRHGQAEVSESPLPSPERVFASHGPRRDASKNLAYGAEAAFLASHFGGSASTFAPLEARGGAIFGAILGGDRATNANQPNDDQTNERSFFSPEVRSAITNQPAPQPQNDVIPSRYGRIEDEAESAFDLSERKNITTIVEQPSVFQPQTPAKTPVILTSTEFGKTDLPLDLSQYLKAYINN